MPFPKGFGILTDIVSLEFIPGVAQGNFTLPCESSVPLMFEENRTQIIMIFMIGNDLKTN
jgi:hypothetical protein